MLTESNVKYTRPLYLDDTATVIGWVRDVRPASMTVRCDVMGSDGRLTAQITQHVVTVRQSTGKPLRTPADLKIGFQKFISEDA